MAVRTWPDAATFQACAQHPARHFADPQLQSAAFEPDRRRGGIQAWSGGRATVIRANRSVGGPVAVRLSRQADDDASTRYRALSRFMAAHPLDFLVSATWQDQGFRLGADTFPILMMDWVPGTSLDNYLSRTLGKVPATTIGEVAAQWREGCRVLAGAKLGHGDVHAGNTMVDDAGGGGLRLRLVDYDSIWFPGLTASVREIGHPAFQHPRRSELPPGPALDALPNTLTYLSLLALARNPGLWTYHRVDDGLVFDRADLADPTRPVWTALLAESDRSVVELARTTIDWLTGPPARYGSLEQAIAAAGAAGGRINVWPARPAGVPRPPSGAGQRIGGAVPPRSPNNWPPRPPGGAPSRSPAPGAGRNGDVGPSVAARPGPSSGASNTWPPSGTRSVSSTSRPGPSSRGDLTVLLVVLAVLVVVIVLGIIAAR